MKIILIAIFIVAVLLFLICYLLFRISMDSKFPIPGALMIPEEQLEKRRYYKLFVEELPHEEVSITSYDNLRLAGHLYPYTADVPREEPTGAYERYSASAGDDATRRLVIMCHGWRSEWWIDSGSNFHWIRATGSDILLIDERACGASEGRYYSYGVKESRDIMKWAAVMHERFPYKPIYLLGTSLGGGSVLQTISADMPDYIRGIIADSGFTSPYELFTGLAGQWFHIPAHPVVDIVRWYAKMLADIELKCKPSTERIAEKVAADETSGQKFQLLLIHGDEDWMVDYHMSDRNYAAAKGSDHVRYLFVPGASHCASYAKERDAYEGAVAAMFAAE